MLVSEFSFSSISTVSKTREVKITCILQNANIQLALAGLMPFSLFFDKAYKFTVSSYVLCVMQGTLLPNPQQEVNKVKFNGNVAE